MMKDSKIKTSPSFSLLVLVLFGAAFAAVGAYLVFSSSASGPAPSPMPVISRSKPAFASSGTASAGNDASYSTHWGSGSLPGWLAYDLSSVSAIQRGQVIVAWYNDPITTPYDYPLIGDVAYALPRDYTLQVNPAAGGGSAPATGWVTMATVTSNIYHSRQHLIDMTGYNWVRINLTASSGGQPQFNMDVYDAHNGATDSWIILGDSITQDGNAHEPADFSAGSNVSQLVNAQNSSYFPAFEDGGDGGTDSNDMVNNINRWLSIFPGHYVGLAYGTNDANNCASTTTFYNNYVTTVNAILAAGKVPVIPTIPASPSANVQSCGPGFNTKIQQLYTAYPQVVHGPDLWAYFSAHQNQFADGLHPNLAGYAAMRQQWANAMIANVYTPSGDTTPPTVSMTAPANGATVSGSSVTVSASASDDVAVAGVQFKLDGVILQAEDTANPYQITWDTTAASNGAHGLTATARDTSGNTTTSSAVNVTVANTCPNGDVNGDCHVTITDLSIMLSNWSSTTNAQCDLNHNGVVDIFDLSIILSNYGS